MWVVAFQRVQGLLLLLRCLGELWYNRWLSGLVWVIDGSSFVRALRSRLSWEVAVARSSIELGGNDIRIETSGEPLAHTHESIYDQMLGVNMSGWA